MANRLQTRRPRQKQLAHYLGAGLHRFYGRQKRHLPRASRRWRLWLVITFLALLVISLYGAWQEW